MLNLDPSKLLVIAVVAVVLLGPERLPQVARQVGAAWRTFNEFRHRMETEMRSSMPDLPSSAEIARLARSPSALLNHLSTLTPDDPAAAQAAGSAGSAGNGAVPASNGTVPASASGHVEVPSRSASKQSETSAGGPGAESKGDQSAITSMPPTTTPASTTPTTGSPPTAPAQAPGVVGDPSLN